jgi:hypothetical protein
MGRPADARRILAEMESAAAKHYVPADEIAAIYVALGDKDAAFRWLQRACDETLRAVVRSRPSPRVPAATFRCAPAAAAEEIGLDPQRVLAADSSGS